MALKRQYEMSSLFSMASMTDIIFLLLIFFMVTSTYVFPTALELNLPQSAQQTALKPATRIFVYPEDRIVAQFGDDSPQEVTIESLEGFLVDAQSRMPEGEPFNIALFADENIPYGNIVKILDIGARRGIKMVLATKTKPSTTEEFTEATESNEQPIAS